MLLFEKMVFKNIFYDNKFSHFYLMHPFSHYRKFKFSYKCSSSIEDTISAKKT